MKKSAKKIKSNKSSGRTKEHIKPSQVVCEKAPKSLGKANKPKKAKVIELLKPEFNTDRQPPLTEQNKRILVVDIGGSNVKLMIANQPRRKVPSRGGLTPRRLVSAVLANTKDWDYDAISIGFPAPIEEGKIIREPSNLGPGWVNFDFQNALGKPVKVINDAAMQALGSYSGGRMLFLGLGTGLGSALVHHGTLIPLELCEARYTRQLTLEDVLGKRGYKRLGLIRWERGVKEIVGLMRKLFLVDYIVLGGGNVKKITQLPEGTRKGHNTHAFIGGVRMWSEEIEAANKPVL